MWNECWFCEKDITYEKTTEYGNNNKFVCEDCYWENKEEIDNSY